jgi:hypothetical protein
MCASQTRRRRRLVWLSVLLLQACAVRGLLAVAVTSDGEEPGPRGLLERDPTRHLRPGGRVCCCSQIAKRSEELLRLTDKQSVGGEGLDRAHRCFSCRGGANY